jgi:hypothetical protein
MKILIVSRSFHPENSPRSFRTTELALALRERGHDVTVCIPRNCLPALKEDRFQGLHAIDLGPVSWPDISTSHPNRLAALTKRALRRGLNLLLDYPDIELSFRVIKTLSKVRGFDVAISIAAPHSVHWGFSRVKKVNSGICRTWIADCGDPFVGVTIDTFKKPFYFTWIEKDFCRTADYITIPIECARAAYFPEFDSKIRVIPQGLKLPNPNELPIYHPHPVPTFLYCGGFIPGVRDPRPILDYLCKSERPFHFICYTRQTELLEDFRPQLEGRLTVHSYIPRDKMICELAKADFLLNLENGSERQTPSKLIDYAIANRPILSLNSCALDKTAFDEFLEGNYTRRTEVPDASNFDVSKVAAQFESLF